MTSDNTMEIDIFYARSKRMITNEEKKKRSKRELLLTGK